MNRRINQRAPRRPKTELMPGFRVLHCFAQDTNISRLERHIRRLVREFTRAGDLAKVKRRTRLGRPKQHAQ